MVRRRYTIKRLDPWSVLKFGIVANVALLGIFLLLMGVVWFVVDRLQLVDQACGIATDIGFTSCGINAGNLFRALALLGLLWVVIQTAVLVFLAFLHNLIADLTGGLVVGVVEEGAAPSTARPRAGSPAAARGRNGPDSGYERRSGGGQGQTRQHEAAPPASGTRRPDEAEDLFSDS